MAAYYTQPADLRADAIMISPQLAQQVLNAAQRRNIMLCSAESCTGGMIAAALTDIAGSSRVFDQAFVTYSNAAKTDMLQVPPDLIAQYGAVSEPVVKAMAQGARQCAKADIAIATSGIAGPGRSEQKPEGRVCFAIATPASTWAQTIEFGALGRMQVRLSATQHALKWILAILKHQDPIS